MQVTNVKDGISAVLLSYSEAGGKKNAQILDLAEHIKIEKGLKPCAIAERLRVHNATIYRELKRTIRI